MSEQDEEVVLADVIRSSSGRIICDPETGKPIMLAVRKPGQVAAQPNSSGISVVRGAAAGNPNYDPKTGQFARGESRMEITGDKKLWDKLTEEAKAYIRAQAKIYSPDTINLSASGTEVNVVFRKGTSALASFTVPTTASDDTAKAALPASETPAVVAATPSTIPPGVDPEVWRRRMDMVRQAARENDDMDVGDVREFLQGRVADMSQVDVDAFLRDVREQRMDDLLDILDQQTRPKVEGLQRARRLLKITAPKGFTRRVFNGMSDDEVITLVKRLEGRGYDPADLSKVVISKITNEERRSRLEQLYGQSKPKSGRKASR